MIETKTLARSVLPLALAALAACDGGLTDVNENPNEPVDVGAEYLFTNAVEASVSRVTGSTVNLDLAGLWAQHYAESRYTEQDRYELSDGTVQTQWVGFYAGPLEDLTEVIDKGRAAGRPNVEAMGTVMRAWTFQAVTDLWGDIGYADALRGRIPGTGTTVAFDAQRDVYAGLIAELDAAGDLLDPSGVRMGAADLIYGGDPAKWEKFANSLRLRLAMRMSAADANAARAAFVAALADGVFTGNADAARLAYLNNGVNTNPVYEYARTRDDHAVSATLVDTLAHLNDPRLAIYAQPNRGGYYKGDPNGDLRDFSLDSISRIGTWFLRADAPAWLQTYAEVLFLQAEAAERGWIPGDAAALYRAAIRASMEQFGIASGAIDAYLAQPRVAYAGLASIGLQKWIALYGNGAEAYAEWRRTGYPMLRPGPDALNEGRIPVRLPYPASEASLNGDALEAAVARQGGAGLSDPVWWDRN